MRVKSACHGCRRGKSESELNVVVEAGRSYCEGRRNKLWLGIVPCQTYTASAKCVVVRDIKASAFVNVIVVVAVATFARMCKKYIFVLHRASSSQRVLFLKFRLRVCSGTHSLLECLHLSILWGLSHYGTFPSAFAEPLLDDRTAWCVTNLRQKHW